MCAKRLIVVFEIQVHALDDSRTHRKGELSQPWASDEAVCRQCGSDHLVHVCISFIYHCISCVYHLYIICISFVYHVYIMCISFVAHVGPFL